MKYEVQERRAGVEKKVRHLFTVPDFGEPNFYRLCTSISGFRNRMHKLNIEFLPHGGARMKRNLKLSFHVHYLDDVELGRQVFAEMHGEERLQMLMEREFSKTIEHAGLKEFYAFIGFDHKRNRFDGSY